MALYFSGLGGVGQMRFGLWDGVEEEYVCGELMVMYFIQRDLMMVIIVRLWLRVSGRVLED